jgi:CheY-like chemotaxis protein
MLVAPSRSCAVSDLDPHESAVVTTKVGNVARTGSRATTGSMFGATVAAPTILLVDDDLSALEMFRCALQDRGFSVLGSTTGGSANHLVRRHPIGLMIMDLRLPDMSGIEIIRRLIADGNPRPFILVSGFLTIEISVEAMRLGALDVLEKPVTIDRLVSLVETWAHNSVHGGGVSTEASATTPLPYNEGRPGSSAHRWAMYVVKAYQADGDVRTLEDWARCAGVSYSTLCESCRLIGIQPQAARDFTRALRAIIKSGVYHCNPSVLLNVSDRRTLKVLLERAGPFFRCGETISILQFIRHQRFVPASNEGNSNAAQLFRATFVPPRLSWYFARSVARVCQLAV